MRETVRNGVKKISEKYNKIKPYFYLGNLLIFLAKIALFCITKSFAFAISSVYNLGIGLAKRKIYFNKNNFSSVGNFLIVASFGFVAYSVWIILSHKVVYYSIYTGIAIATVTFCDIGYSIYGIHKSIKLNNKQNNLLMLVNLSTALVSLELTQSALLSFTQVGVDNSLYNGIIGIAAGIGSLIIGLVIHFKK